MANWRLAESLKKLREQINEAFPGRSRSSDGSVGDLSHQARPSDHNPNGAGAVTAIDVTSDAKSGCTGDRLSAALIKSRDPRIKYIIWNRRIFKTYPSSGKPAWSWHKYTGANAHAHHMHISVAADKSLYDSKAEWDLDFDVAVVQSPTDSPTIPQRSEAITADLPQPPAPGSSEGETSQPAQTITPPDPPQQTNEQGASGQQVVIQPNALTTPQLPIVPSDEKAIDVEAVTPEKSGAKKSIWATIVAGITFLGLNVQAFFTNAYATVKDNPVAAMGLIVGCLVIVVVYWKYQERQTKLDELREKQAHELTLKQMELAADQQKYSVNVVKATK